MKRLSGNEIREIFLRFFESKGHKRVRSSSLVPHGDPTLLFTNAGMNQFKDVFLGLEKRDYNKATTAQKVVRAGGKHNDLENVGFTKRHHTFFEMLGNFSFGDYFKEKAIPYAWELVTSPEWFGIPKEKLYVTIFGGAEVAPGNTLGVDEDARAFWLKENVPAERVVPVSGLKDNFWAMGDTGPCGPCSEIFYDMGVEASEEGHTDCKFPCDCGRYVEIWNLVFMQFNRYCERERSGHPHTEAEQLEAATSGLAGSAKTVHEYFNCLCVEPLPKPCVDTGLGLERTACVLQGVISNYDTDLFLPLIGKAGELLRAEPKLNPNVAPSLRIIADHARATAFLISDGVLPSNEGRGYVLRKIMRRAIRHGHMWGTREPFLYKMVDLVRTQMDKAYPELLEAAQNVTNVVLAEERQFGRTIETASTKLVALIDSAKGAASDKCIQDFSTAHSTSIDDEKKKKYAGYLLPGNSTEDRNRAAIELVGAKLSAQLVDHFSQNYKPMLLGAIAFPLYDTYGLPLDFIADAARDMGVRFDHDGFDAAMEVQRRTARASWKGGSKETASPAYAKIAERFKTEKDFYHATSAKDCKVEAIISKNGPVNELKPGEAGEVVLDRTPIYAESGGQMADTGWFYDPTGTGTLAEVTGAYYPVAGLVAHKVIAKETLHVGDRVCVDVDTDRHARIIRNHSGTHLVHAALRNILGTHVKQAGSLNSPERLRFDFSHFAHVDPEELRDIEQQVNDEIRYNTQIETNISTLDDALASGALAFFGDKYPESNVRVVTIPDERAPRGFYSKELCGGTHVHRIGDIGVLKIVSEGSVAAGVRRIEAVTGIGALEHYEHQAKVLAQVASQLNVGEDAVLATVEKLATTVKQLEKELEAQKRKGALGQLDQLAAQAQTVKGVKIIAAEAPGTDKEALRQLVDSLRQKLGSGVVALATGENGKVSLIMGVTKDLTAKVHAGKLIQTLSAKLGGKGGGRPDLAEGGGTDTSALKSVLSTIPGLLEPLL